MKHLYFTVTNDLTYDQRMHRICGTLSRAGYSITLVGRELAGSAALVPQPFRQKRLRCFFNRSFLFYAEYNLRLFFYLVGQKMDGICAIDLDTILPCYFVSVLKKLGRVYDAHEYFTDLKEVRTRPAVRWFWKAVEKFAVPKFRFGYTVSQGLANAFRVQYGQDYAVIRNLPVLQPPAAGEGRENFLLYQGAVNEGRGFEVLIPAMRHLGYNLVICGDGNFMSSLKKLIAENGVSERVRLTGMLPPAELRQWAAKARLGLCLAEKEGLNQYQALPNKFLEYMHAGLPQVAMNFPEYRKINEQYQIAVLVDDLTVAALVETIETTMNDNGLLSKLEQNAGAARVHYCWQAEEKRLLDFYKNFFGE